MIKKRIGAFMLAAAMLASVQVGTMALSVPGSTGLEVAEAASLSSSVGLYASFYHKFLKVHIVNCYEESITGTITVTGYDSNGKYMFSTRGSFSCDADDSEYIKYNYRNVGKAKIVLSNIKVGGKSISGSITKEFED